jgi:hypothetical protein
MSVLGDFHVGICWWCGSVADSREHRFKRTDLVQEFGPGPYIGRDETVAKANDGGLTTVQGPRSSAAKFKPTMCKVCNGVRSQPFDRAYAKLTGFICSHEAMILQTRAIDLRRVFGSTWKKDGADLSRYVVKHAACRLADWSVGVGEPVRAFLDGDPYPSWLAMDCEVRTDIVAMTRYLRDRDIPEGSLWLGPATQILDNNGKPSGIQSFMGYRWFRVYWGFGEELAGYRPPFRHRILRLTEGHSMPPEGISVGPGSFG